MIIQNLQTITPDHQDKDTAMQKDLSDLIIYCQTKSGGLSRRRLQTDEMKYYHMSSMANVPMKKLLCKENSSNLYEYHSKILNYY